jgi:hypothetical protein
MQSSTDDQGVKKFMTNEVLPEESVVLTLSAAI